MSFQIIWTKTAQARYNQLEMDAVKAFEGRKAVAKKKISKQEGLFKQVSKAIELLQENHTASNKKYFYNLAYFV